MNRDETEEVLKLTLLTVAVVATILAVSKSQVYGLVRRGKLEAINVGLETRPVFRIKSDSVRRLLDEGFPK